LALNKHIQFQAAHEAGFNVPRFLLAQKADEIIRFTVRGSFPVILKPVRPVSIADGRIVKCPTWVCANRAELDYALEHWSERVPILIQELIAGIGEGVFGLSASDGVRAWSAHRRLRMMNPQGSGSSACVSVSVPEDVREKAQRFIDNTAWRGLFMLELLRDRAGKAWFIELNGRPWGSMALARRQGLEYPAWQARLAIDPKFEIVTEPIPIPGLVSRHVGREIMHLLFVMKGPKSKALTDWPRFWRTLGEVLRIHRRDSLYNWRRDDLRVFFADCYYTLYDNVFKSRS
jgi:predicted ATP-grasp superfamily ATP-dependent carboligase